MILLKGTSLAINEVALMLGYRNSSHFYMAFREYYGVSPREYIQYLSKQYLLAYLYYRVAMKASTAASSAGLSFYCLFPLNQ